MSATDHLSDEGLPRKRGPKPQPREYVASRVLQVYVTPRERMAIESIASEEQVSLSELLRDAVEHILSQRQRNY